MAAQIPDDTPESVDPTPAEPEAAEVVAATPVSTAARRPGNRGIRLLRGLIYSYVLLLAGIWLIEWRIAERHWFATLITYAPQILTLAPLPFLLLPALWKRDLRSLAGLSVAAALVIALLAPVLRSPSSKTGDLSIVTYNIEHASGGVTAIATQIRLAKPDIVCLQEVNGYKSQPDPLPALREALPDWRIEWAGEVALATRLPIDEYRPIRYSIRGVKRQALRVKVATARGPLTVIVAHLATAANPESVETQSGGKLPAYLKRTTDVRSEQIEILLREIKTIDGPIVLCGDFNTPPRSRFHNRLAANLTDSFAAAGSGLGWTYPANRPLWRIDYIFAGHGARPVAAEVLPWRQSDHRPLRVALTLPKLTTESATK